MSISELNRSFRRYFSFNAPIDMTLTMIKGPGNACLDIIKLDERLAEHDSEYNPDECIWRDEKDISMAYYIELKYGVDARRFIESVI